MNGTLVANENFILFDLRSLILERFSKDAETTNPDGVVLISNGTVVIALLEYTFTDF